MLTLYVYPKSRSLRTVWAAEEIHLDCVCKRVDIRSGEGHSAEYLKLHPGGKVPLLDDNGTFIFESGAICRYLVDAYGHGTIKPATQLAQGLVDQWICFALSELEQPLWTEIKHTRVLPEEKRVPAILSVASWEFDRAVETLISYFDPEKADWLVENEFSLADMFISHTLALGEQRGHNLPESLTHYVERCMSRPAFARAVRREEDAVSFL